MRFHDDDFIYRIVGIDNGSSQLGIVAVDLDLRTNHYHLLDATTLKAQRLVSKHTGLSLSHGDAWMRFNTLSDGLLDYLDCHRPHAVAVETPFFMPGRVQSFKVLSEMMVFIRQAVADYGLDSDVIAVTPGEAKRAVQTGKFTMSKSVIPDCIRRLPNLICHNDIDIDTLSEHEYDAIAAVMHHGKQVRVATGYDRDTTKR